MEPFTICVEGNIGSGKTTFLKYFEGASNISVLEEPVNLWRNVNGQNLLALFYADPAKYAYIFQHYVQITMLQSHKQNTGCEYKIMERSIYSAQHFINQQKRNGLLSELECSILGQWRTICEAPVDLFVYLRTDPEISFQRIQRRNRAEESLVSLDYIQQIHQWHEDWVDDMLRAKQNIMILNANRSSAEIFDDFLKL